MYESTPSRKLVLRRKLLAEHLEDRRLLAVMTVNDLSDDTLANLADDGMLSLREAIEAISTGADIDGIPPTSGEYGTDDQIVFDPALFDESQVLPMNAGEFALTRSTSINGPGQDLLTIDAQDQSGIFHISAEEGDFILSGMTMTRGNAMDGSGGAVRSVTNGDLSIVDSTISESQALLGAGISVMNTNLTLIGATIADNVADQLNSLRIMSGAGVFAENATVTITDSIISGNSIIGKLFSGGQGPAISVANSSLTLSNTTVTDNHNRANPCGCDPYSYGFAGAIHGDSSTMTLTGSVVDGNTGGRYGGGVSAFESTLTIAGSEIDDNRGRDGGGVYVRDSIMTINDSSVSGNTAYPMETSFANYPGRGGGIASRNSQVTVANSTISSNVEGIIDPYPLDNFGGGGVSIYGGSLVLENSLVTGNVASVEGGGIAAGGADLVIRQSTFSNNQGQRGGGLHASNSTVLISDSTMSGNKAVEDADQAFFPASGGAIWVTGSTLSVVNSTVSGNQAIPAYNTASAGGIATENSSVELVNSTITDNRATTSGGGIYVSGDDGSLMLRNSILAGNHLPEAGGSDLDIDSTAELTFSDSLIGIGDGAYLPLTGMTPNENGNLVGSSADPLEAMLGPLTDNGGPTLTHALLPGSLAIDAGSNALAVDSEGAALAFDQRGDPFVRIFGESVDMGSYELRTTLAADFDHDGDVDTADRTILTQNWTGALLPGEGDRTFEQGDADGDGDVDTADATLLTQNWTGALRQVAVAIDAQLADQRDEPPSTRDVDEVFEEEFGIDEVLVLPVPASFFLA